MIIALLAIATLAGACGGGGDDNTAVPGATSGDDGGAAVSSIPATTTAAPAAAAAGAGACKYVTTAQASGLAASPVKPGVTRSVPGPVTFEYCDYIFDPGNAPGVTVAVADLGTGGASLFDQFRQSKASAEGFQAVPGIGDEAFYGAGNLNVRKGNKGLIVFVGRTNSLPRGVGAIPDEKQLAALILPQL